MHTETSLFRIAQEILNNVAKHSGATTVVIGMTQDDRDIALVIEDNGKGFDQDQVKKSKKKGRWGLTNITERALSIGGNCVSRANRERGPAYCGGPYMNITVVIADDHAIVRDGLKLLLESQPVLS